MAVLISMSQFGLGDRVLACLPDKTDTQAVHGLLREREFFVRQCESIAELCEEIGQGAGCVLVSSQIFDSIEADRLIEILNTQPTWSDLGVVVLTESNRPLSARLLGLLSGACNVNLYDLSLGKECLLYAIKLLVRDRRRQYALRSLIKDDCLVSYAAVGGTVDSIENRGGDILVTDPVNDRLIDSSEREMEASDIRHNEERLRQILDSRSVGIFFWGDSDSLYNANRCFLELLGYTQDDIRRGIAHAQLMPEQHKEAYTCAFEEIRSHGSCAPFEIELIGKNGEVVPVLMSGTYLAETRQGVAYVIDIRDRVSTEKALIALNERLETKVAERTKALLEFQEEIRRTERLSSVGTLAAGIAHEINNPLNSILMSAEYLLMREEPNNAKEVLQTICEEARRGGEIVRGILKFARYDETSKQKENLNEIVERACSLAHTYMIDKNINFAFDLDESVPEILINATEIEQVVVNLIKNAAEAANGSVTIDVKTSMTEGGVVLTIADNGPGIPEETVAHIFDPFFSTKLSAGGTGLGLSIVHGIVSDHAGTIQVHSKVGSGTEFRITFPYMEGA